MVNEVFTMAEICNIFRKNTVVNYSIYSESEWDTM